MGKLHSKIPPTVIFIVLSTAASAFNYFVYPLLSRILPSSEYVNTTVSLSILTQIGTFMSAILAINIGLSKEKITQKSQSYISDQLNNKIALLFLFVGILFLLFAPIIMPHIQTPIFYAVPISIMMLMSVPIAVISGHLNGLGRMAQLGIATLAAASSQFVLAITIALITHNGFATLLGMALSQIFAVLLIYTILGKESLPALTSLRAALKPSTEARATVRSLLVYTIIASFAIMGLNLLQVVDLIIVKNTFPVDAHFYTDIYVISRIVFFAGMIFIWPFLGQINIKAMRSNLNSLIKLLGIFALISFLMLLISYVGGSWLFRTIFDHYYLASSLFMPVLLSVLYKVCLLMLTAICLYFIVVRSWSILVILGSTATLLTIGITFIPKTNIIETLGILTASAFIGACIAVALYFVHNNKPNCVQLN